MRTTLLTLLLAVTGCGSDAPEDCSDCGSSLYDKDYLLVLDEGQATGASTIAVSLALDGFEVAKASAQAYGGLAHWGLPVTVHATEEQHFVLLARIDGRVAIVADLPQVPAELLTSGALTLTGDGASITLRAYDDASRPMCVADDECGNRARCVGEACVDGVRCGGAACSASEICGDDACLANPLTSPRALTLVDAELAPGNWDTGFATDPNPAAFVWLDDVQVLTGPEHADTYAATWNASLTDTFDPYATLRVQVVDVDVTESQVALDVTFPTFPYELIRDGTLTLTRDGTRVTLTLTP